MNENEKKLLQAKHRMEEAQRGTGYESAKPGHGGSFKRVLFWKRLCPQRRRWT